MNMKLMAIATTAMLALTACSKGPNCQEVAEHIVETNEFVRMINVDTRGMLDNGRYLCGMQGLTSNQAVDCDVYITGTQVRAEPSKNDKNHCLAKISGMDISVGKNELITDGEVMMEFVFEAFGDDGFRWEAEFLAN